jgi:branched-chain amino acid transport system permease protein
METPAAQWRAGRANRLGAAGTIGAALPFLVLLVLGVLFPLFGGGYWGVIATRACVYWVLVSGLNLVVGFAGQIAIGWVALLTLGAYTTSVLTAGNVMPPLPPYLALAIAGVAGAVFGLIIGLPALRLRTFYFAITTLGFATIVTQVALAWQSVTGGGVGVPGPIFPEPFSSQWGFYYFCFGLAAICTWMTVNVAGSRFGRALTAIRDAEVAAEACGIAKPALLRTVFLFSGAVAAVAGGLFASLQSYITPDAFTLDLSILFFISILIGGRGSVLGPLLGTLLLTALPEFAAPLVAWSTFLYAVLLLVIVLAIPGGIAEILDFKNRRPLESDRAIIPRPDLLPRLLGAPAAGAFSGKVDFRFSAENATTQEAGARLTSHAQVNANGERSSAGALTLEGVALSFGGVHAIADLDLEIQPGQVHGLIGPNGSGKTTTLNVISGYYAQQRGSVRLNGAALPVFDRPQRARMRIARTFQTPRIVGSASVLENVMIGGTIDGEGTFVESLLSLPRHRRDEVMLRDAAMLALAVVGLERLAAVRADRLQHSELRFTEIARALMLRPAFVLLDEPAAGLSAEEIRRLGALLLAIARAGTGVLLVEHHADLIFDICHHVTVLNLGRMLAAGTPAEIRSHREVVHAYLGG